jgi:putative glutamine amidotransferase
VTTKPLIGVTGGRRPNERGVMFLYAVPSYVHAVEVTDGLPVLLPVNLDLNTLETIYHRLDGVVLTGGGDVSPAAYNAEPASTVQGTDELRDAVEFALARWAIRDDKPLLAICRGIQVLNVALGGTLYQHIPDDFDTDLEHDHTFATHRAYLAHTASVEPASRLAAALGVVETPVNSLHHQAVDRPAENLRVVAHASDGLIEGLEHPARRFVVSVQWHPEELVDTEPVMRRLFWSFVQAASGRDDWQSLESGC